MNIGLLRSAVSRPFATFEGKDLYSDIFRKAAALMESLARNHPFLDGNKRTAITSAGVFLAINGYQLETGQRELERFTLSVAKGEVPFERMVDWFKRRTSKGNEDYLKAVKSLKKIW